MQDLIALAFAKRSQFDHSRIPLRTWLEGLGIPQPLLPSSPPEALVLARTTRFLSTAAPEPESRTFNNPPDTSGNYLLKVIENAGNSVSIIRNDNENQSNGIQDIPSWNDSPS